MRESKIVVTFSTTTQAMAWEKACKEAKLPGRLIPMPVQISAECGQVWVIAPREKIPLLQHAAKLNLKYADVIELK